MEVQYGREKGIHTRESETSQSKSQEVDFVLETVEQMVKYHGISLVGQVFKLLHKLQKQSQDDDSINKRAFPLQRNQSGVLFCTRAELVQHLLTWFCIGWWEP